MSSSSSSLTNLLPNLLPNLQFRFNHASKSAIYSNLLDLIIWYPFFTIKNNRSWSCLLNFSKLWFFNLNQQRQNFLHPATYQPPYYHLDFDDFNFLANTPISNDLVKSTSKALTWTWDLAQTEIVIKLIFDRISDCWLAGLSDHLSNQDISLNPFQWLIGMLETLDFLTRVIQNFENFQHQKSYIFNFSSFSTLFKIYNFNSSSINIHGFHRAWNQIRSLIVQIIFRIYPESNIRSTAILALPFNDIPNYHTLALKSFLISILYDFWYPLDDSNNDLLFPPQPQPFSIFKLNQLQRSQLPWRQFIPKNSTPSRNSLYHLIKSHPPSIHRLRPAGDPNQILLENILTNSLLEDHNLNQNQHHQNHHGGEMVQILNVMVANTTQTNQNLEQLLHATTPSIPTLNSIITNPSILPDSIPSHLLINPNALLPIPSLNLTQSSSNNLSSTSSSNISSSNQHQVLIHDDQDQTNSSDSSDSTLSSNCTPFGLKFIMEENSSEIESTISSNCSLDSHNTPSDLDFEKEQDFFQVESNPSSDDDDAQISLLLTSHSPYTSPQILPSTSTLQNHILPQPILSNSLKRSNLELFNSLVPASKLKQKRSQSSSPVASTSKSLLPNDDYEIKSQLPRKRSRSESPSQITNFSNNSLATVPDHSVPEPSVTRLNSKSPNLPFSQVSFESPKTPSDNNQRNMNTHTKLNHPKVLTSAAPSKRKRQTVQDDQDSNLRASKRITRSNSNHQQGLINLPKSKKQTKVDLLEAKTTMPSKSSIRSSSNQQLQSRLGKRKSMASSDLEDTKARPSKRTTRSNSNLKDTTSTKSLQSSTLPKSKKDSSTLNTMNRLPEKTTRTLTRQTKSKKIVSKPQNDSSQSKSKMGKSLQTSKQTVKLGKKTHYDHFQSGSNNELASRKRNLKSGRGQASSSGQKAPNIVDLKTQSIPLRRSSRLKS
ncbi:hypothetical protein O181_064929 [Austropuccinia psidii MF-1]|uniref:Uncharacterized protein n=1 Tax=Austropuccinia psidii MF-1 TaxID=1389203 RepID=A0A9Q3EQI0_9BASI|nr:hypothetical protein [Austropuccinia psidii MF-1]